MQDINFYFLISHRSEIDRLTALLQSKTVDFPTGNEEKKSEAIASKAMVSQGKELLTTPVNNGFDGRFNSTPIVSSSVGEFNMLHLYFFLLMCVHMHLCVICTPAHAHSSMALNCVSFFKLSGFAPRLLFHIEIWVGVILLFNGEYKGGQQHGV